MFDLHQFIFVMAVGIVSPGCIVLALISRAENLKRLEQKKEQDYALLRRIYFDIGGWSALDRYGESRPANKNQMRLFIQDTKRILDNHPDLYPVLAVQVSILSLEFWLEYLDDCGYSAAHAENAGMGKPMHVHVIWTATRSYIHP